MTEGVALARLWEADSITATELATLFMDARAQAMPWLPVCHDLASTADFLVGEIARATTWVARDAANRIQGLIVFDNSWIDHLYIAPAMQGRGLGRRLLQQALADGEARQLWCFADNTAARRFYESAGFRVVESTDGSHNEERCADVRYHYAGNGAAITRTP
ncbi:MAG: GNAT family N-acetyltransferase [Burkholderiales bacterium]|nr:GNAT family N-acetyltransferase [Burkholderiales bacterium]